MPVLRLAQLAAPRHRRRRARDRKGRLDCQSCQLERPVRDGVADLMLDPSPQVRAEAEGLERFALQMRRDGWDRARVLRLPDEKSGYWWAQRWAMERNFGPGHVLRRARFGRFKLRRGRSSAWVQRYA